MFTKLLTDPLGSLMSKRSEAVINSMYCIKLALRYD